MIHERHICALVEEMMLVEMLEIDLPDSFKMDKRAEEESKSDWLLVFLWCQSGFILSRFDCWGIGECWRVQFWSSRWGWILWLNLAHHQLQLLTLWSRKKKKQCPVTSSDACRIWVAPRKFRVFESHARTFYCKLRLSSFACIDSMWSLKQLWLHLVLSWQMHLIQSNFWIAWRNWRVVYQYRYLCMISSAINDLWTRSARYLFFFPTSPF